MNSLNAASEMLDTPAVEFLAEQEALQEYWQEHHAGKVMEQLGRDSFFVAALHGCEEADIALALKNSDAAQRAVAMVAVLIGKDLEMTEGAIELMGLPETSPERLIEIPRFILHTKRMAPFRTLLMDRGNPRITNNQPAEWNTLPFDYMSSCAGFVRRVEGVESKITLAASYKEYASDITMAVSHASALAVQHLYDNPEYQVEVMETAIQLANCHEITHGESNKEAFNSYMTIIMEGWHIKDKNVLPVMYEALMKLHQIANAAAETDPDFCLSVEAKALITAGLLTRTEGVDKNDVKLHVQQVLERYPYTNELARRTSQRLLEDA